MYIHTHPPTPFISAVITEDNDSWSWNKNVYIYMYIYKYTKLGPNLWRKRCTSYPKLLHTPGHPPSAQQLPCESDILLHPPSAPVAWRWCWSPLQICPGAKLSAPSCSAKNWIGLVTWKHFLERFRSDISTRNWFLGSAVCLEPS